MQNMINNPINLEICCGNFQSAGYACLGGAKRIELCSGLAEGGLTPTIGTLVFAKQLGIPEINVLVRNRPGDFVYTQTDAAIMAADAKMLVEYGATGIVIGALTPDGEIDKRACQTIINVVRKSTGKRFNITFHRAFDLAKDPVRALEDIIDLGCDCLLTSGMAPTAAEGLDTLHQLVELANGRIEIMAGCGVNPENAAEIILTGVNAIHATARKPLASQMKFHRPNVPMGTPGSDEYSRLETDTDTVSKLLRICEASSKGGFECLN